jgi:methylated-DNA-[protein]-cysteine S-methyltransferase
LPYTHTFASPLGGIFLASDGDALTGLWFDGQKYFGRGLSGTCEARDLPIFSEAEKWLRLYFQGENPGFVPELRPRGTPFQTLVWKILQTIPYGETRTYGEIAAQVAYLCGKPHMSAQAVGNAVGHNPLSLLIPCHRVVGANGSLTGYAGGVEKKRRLLQLERVDVSRFCLPRDGEPDRAI